MTGQQDSAKTWYLILFLTFLNVINFVDRNLIVGFSKAIVDDLKLTNTQYGLLTGIVFTLFYTFVGVLLGMMADRFHRPRLIAAGLFIWSIMTAASGAARNFAQMGTARLLVGVGEATLTPTALSLLSDVVPPHRRAMASGFYYMGVPVGTGAGLIMAGILGPKLGWRNSFYIMGLLGVALTGLVLLIKEPPRGGLDNVKSPKKSPGFSTILRDLFAALRTSPALCWVIVGSVVTHIGLSVTFFDIRWLIAERGLDAASAPMVVGGVFTLAGAVATAFGGRIADYYHDRYEGGKLKFLAVVLLAAIPLAITYRFVPLSNPIFYVCLFSMCAALTVFYGPVFSAIQDLAPVHVRSTAIAFSLFMSNMAGIGLGAFLTGAVIDHLAAVGKGEATPGRLVAWLLDRTGGQLTAEPMTYGTLLFALVGMTAPIPYFIAAHYYQRSLERLQETR